MKESKIKSDYELYKDDYSNEGLMDKLTRFAKSAGLNTTYYVLLLYHILQSAAVTFKDKAIIIGTLGYFISPFDVVPDFIIGAGLLDDAGALAIALSSLYRLITPAIKNSAKKHLHSFFSFKDDELDSEYR